MLACFITTVILQALKEKCYHLITLSVILSMSVCALLKKGIFPVSIRLGLTGVVPAASSGAASPPRAVELHGVPVAETVITQNVWSQVTDL